MRNGSPLPTRIIVDADACPVKDVIERAAKRHGVKVLMATATAMRDRGDLVEIVRIQSGPDAVDDWIVEQCRPGDIVVTQDIPLAAAIIARGGRIIENRGEILDQSNIGPRLAMRDLAAGLRDAGVLEPGISGPRAFSNKDRNRFAQSLGRLLDETRNMQ